MKKIFVILTVVFSICTSSNYAQSNTPSIVIGAFQQSFDKATNTSWSTVHELYRADFIWEDQKVSAFFNADGDLIASSRDVTLLQIPMSLKSNLEKNYVDYKISNLLEVNKEDGIVYLVTLTNNKNQLTLKSSSGEWFANKKNSY